MNLDSLMDALTNVVAVLILVLVLVQADAAKKVEQYYEALEPATEEDLAKTQEQLKKLIDQKEQAEQLKKEDPPDPQELEKAKQSILRLQQQIDSKQTELAHVDELRKLEEKVRQELDTEKKKTEALQKEIAMLESSLDQTPILKPIAPAEVTIPDSQDIPPTADVFYALARGDRVHFVDTIGPLKEFEQVFKKERNDWKIEKVEIRGEDVVIYDQEKITALLAKTPLRNNQGHRIEVPANPMGDRLFVDIYPDLEKGGTTIDQLRQKDNPFGFLMRQLAMNNRNAVVIFRVSPDAFPTYLEARKFVDLNRISAGWEVYGDVKIRTWIPDLMVKRLKDPPPRPPPDPNKKEPERPPQLKTKLD